jgi:ribosomal protein S18 acetylase RimI-like enzyme
MNYQFVPMTAEHAQTIVAQIRPARLADSAALAHIQVDNYQTAYAGILPQDYLNHFTYTEQEQDWRDCFSAERSDVLLVAENGTGEVVGYALGRPGLSGLPPYDGELISLHVRHWHQRQGVGRRLVAAVAQELEEHGCSSLMLWVLAENPACGFYERLGGRLLDQRKEMRYWEGDPAIEVAYGWLNIESLCEVRRNHVRAPQEND